MKEERQAIMGRLFAVFGLLLLLPTAIAVQLVRINIWEGEALRELWSDQAIDFISIPAQRGDIYDANGSLLATNSVGYKVAVDPRTPGITRDQLRQVADTLGKYTNTSAVAYLNKIDTSGMSRYVVLSKNVSIEAYDALDALDIRGVILEEQYRRRYNFGNLAAHTLGFVNHQMTGVTGLESTYDQRLKGTDGQQQVRRDRSGRIFAYVGAPRRQPVQGQSLHTTIDMHIQAILEEELKAGIDRTKSNNGTAIIMDPRTGAIKAMANYPTFDPNKPASTDGENRRNFAVSDMVEPGSTFKLVTAIAAIEQGVVSFDETFETPESGQQLINGQWMRDHDPLGTLSFEEVIEKSSNIATAEIAMRIAPTAFYQYARNLGFGTPTNIDLPNEEDGRLQKPYEWSSVTLPWMSIGYEVQVTPLQIIQAYAAFANRGEMMRPYVVDRITDERGDTEWEYKPSVVRKIADEETLEKLYPVFRDVVSDSGTAEWAQIEGMNVAGKTGTAQKYLEGSYQTAYKASFVGFFPMENPKYVCLVILDEPGTSFYGGFTAGPIFKQTALRIAGLDKEIQKEFTEEETIDPVWAIAPKATGMTVDNARALLDALNVSHSIRGDGKWVLQQKPTAGEALVSTDKLILDTEPADQSAEEVPEGYAVIPDFTGMNMRSAVALAGSRGFEMETRGSGTIYTQFPRAGDLMKKGRPVTVRGKTKSLETLISAVDSP